MFEFWLDLMHAQRVAYQAQRVAYYMTLVDEKSFLKWQYPAPAELQFAGVMC